MLGICTHYTRGEAAYFATRLASFGAERGISIKLGSMKRPAVIGTEWDRRVAYAGDFPSWVVGCSRVLWTHVPPAQQVAHAKLKGLRTAVLCRWHATNADDRAVLREVDRVFVPTREVAKYAQARWQLTNLSHLPWDNGAPLSRKPCREAATRRLVLPLFDELPWRTEHTAVDVGSRMLVRYPDATLDVLYNSSTLSGCASRRLRRYRRLFRDRLRLVPSRSVTRRAWGYRDYDLMLYMAHVDDWGMSAIDAVTAGTPVIAFAVPPLSELLPASSGLRLVPCPWRYSPTGLPQATPDFNEMEANLHALLDQPAALARLQEETSQGLQQRRTLFVEAIRRFIEP